MVFHFVEPHLGMSIWLFKRALEPSRFLNFVLCLNCRLDCHESPVIGFKCRPAHNKSFPRLICGLRQEMPKTSPTTAGRPQAVFPDTHLKAWAQSNPSYKPLDTLPENSLVLSLHKKIKKKNGLLSIRETGVIRETFWRGTIFLGRAQNPLCKSNSRSIFE